MDSELGQSQLFEVFIDGLNSNQIARAILRKGEETLVDVLATAAQEETLVDSLRTRGREEREDRGSKREAKGINQSPTPVQCTACGRYGHRSQDCRSRVPATTSQNPPRDAVICYSCGKVATSKETARM